MTRKDGEKKRGERKAVIFRKIERVSFNETPDRAFCVLRVDVRIRSLAWRSEFANSVLSSLRLKLGKLHLTKVSLLIISEYKDSIFSTVRSKIRTNGY